MIISAWEAFCLLLCTLVSYWVLYQATKFAFLRFSVVVKPENLPKDENHES